MAAIRAEMGTRWMLFEILLLPLVAYAASVAVYQAGIRLF